MSNSLMKERINNNRQRCIPNEMLVYYEDDSYADPNHFMDYDYYDADNKLSYIVYESSKHNDYNDIIDEMMIDSFLDLLTDNERKVVELLRLGFIQFEIAKKINRSYQLVYQYVNIIRKKWKRFLDLNENELKNLNK